MTLAVITGGSGNAGTAIARALLAAGLDVRVADLVPPASDGLDEVSFVRCDTRTPSDVQAAVESADVVVHLAAWHSAHQPPVSNDTMFAVNVNGTYNVLEACRLAQIRSVVYASSMAYSYRWIYGVTKVIGEDLCRAFQAATDSSVVMLRYHGFVPCLYLEFGNALLFNGVDRRDVTAATVASVRAVLERRVDLFTTVVHSDHGMPPHVRDNFEELGPSWCDDQVPGSAVLLTKYAFRLPKRVEQHDLSEAAQVLGWKPSVNFVDFLRDLKRRDGRGEDVTSLRVPSEIPAGEQDVIDGIAHAAG